MRKVALSCAALAVVAGIVSVTLWRKLHLERELTAQLRTSSIELPGNTLGDTRFDPAVPAQLPFPIPNSEQISPLDPLALPELMSNGSVSHFNSDLKLLEDREYRTARIAQLRLSLPIEYPGLAAELGLTKEEAEQMFQLLAEFQLEISAAQMPFPQSIQPIDEATMQRAEDTQGEIQRRQDAAIQYLLGDSRFPQWRQYQKDQPAFQQVFQVSRVMEAAGLPPLSQNQQRVVRDAYIAERNREDAIRSRLQSEFKLGATADPMRLRETGEEIFRQQAEGSERILQVAEGHLDPRQLESLKVFLEQKLEVQRNLSRALQESDTTPRPSF